MSNKTIRINEDKLREIIHEEIKKILSKDTDFDVNDFDLSQISIEDLKSGYRDLRLSPTSRAFGDIFSDDLSINEAYRDILPPDNVSKLIINRYNLPESFVVVMEHFHQIKIYIVTAQIGLNEKLIISDMEKCGYFLGSKSDIKTIYNMKYRVLQFEPISQMQNDETEEIKKKYTFLYHWTASYNVDNIMKEGLIPSHKNTVFNYPDRTYLMESDKPMNKIHQLGFLLCMHNNSINNNGDYTLLSVDITNLDDSIRFYYDPNSEIGIYTETIIPKEKINIVKNTNFFNK